MRNLFKMTFMALLGLLMGCGPNGSIDSIIPKNKIDASCFVGSKEIKHKEEIELFKHDNVLCGASCQKETRICLNGVLSGSDEYIYTTCDKSECLSCDLPWGGEVQDSAMVSAFKDASKNYGESCESEERLCENGFLHGENLHQSCVIGPPASCTLDGITANHGETRTFYKENSVACGFSCESEERVCNNGAYGGDANFNKASCSITACLSCSTPWGQNLNHLESATAFLSETVPYGTTCSSEERICNNGNLSGSNQYSSCIVEDPLSCNLPWGGQIAHGANAEAFLTETVPHGSSCSSEVRSCNNGILSGTNTFGACIVDPPIPPANCSLNGVDFNHGESRTFYQTSSVACGATCASSLRTCNDGVVEGDSNFSEPSCSAQTCLTCDFNGQTIPHEGSIEAYLTATVPFGSSCSSEERICTNGNLSGTYGQSSCQIDLPSNCSLDGVEVLHGDSQIFYNTDTVACGETCSSVSRTCTNGVLSGNPTYNKASCSAVACLSCNLPWGGQISHNATVMAYENLTEPHDGACSSEERICTNGVLSGNNIHQSCSLLPPPIPATLELSTSSINFGVKNILEEFDEVVVKVKNVGEIISNILNLTRTLTNSPYQVVDNCTGTVLLPDEECELSIKYVPEALGPVAETLTISDGNSSDDLDLLAEATSPSSFDPVVIENPAFSPLYTTESFSFIEGTCINGLTVYLSGEIDEEVVCQNNEFSFSLVHASDEAYNYSVAQGNGYVFSPLSNVVIVKDTIEPSPVVITSPVSGSVSASLNVSGTCETNATVIFLKGGIVSGTTTCSSSSFSLNIDEEDEGIYDYSVKQIDLTGNESDAINYSWTKLNSLPSAPLLTPANIISNKTNEVISGNCMTGATVSMSGDHTATTPCIAGAFSFTVNKTTDATYNFTLKQNIYGVDSSNSLATWKRDTVAPNTTINSGPSGIVIGSSTQTFTFSSTESPALFECKHNFGAWTNCTSPWQVEGGFLGGNTFQVRAKDEAGNIDQTPASSSWTVILGF